MRPIEELGVEELRDIKLLVFDVDGVLVSRGTKIRQEGNTTTLETKVVADEQIRQLKDLKGRGFFLNINSGRGLYMLQEMFRNVLEYTSLTYENGSATWIDGRIVQHVNSFPHLRGLHEQLAVDAICHHPNFKGFEPKEMIITIHCKDEIPRIPEIVGERGDNLYCIWNGEAYDIGIRTIQTKAVGLRSLAHYLGLQRENVLAIGDNLNDRELLAEAGIAVTADKTRVAGDYYVPLVGERLPAAIMMDQILRE